MFFFVFLNFAFSSLPLASGRAKALDLVQTTSLVEEFLPNYCNDTELAELHGLHRTALGQFVGYGCSADFFHCRWQSDGFRTYKKACRVGLVFDTDGTQNCNYDYNVKGCAIASAPAKCKNATDFACPLSEKCVTLSQRCDGVYDCVLEEDEQNCPMCRASEFACVVSEQCIPMTARCNGLRDCGDGTDELDCDVCGAEKFYCRKSRKCIPSVERCDGRSQCASGEDEHLCKKESNGMYLCENRQSQVERNLVCDGKEDCPDGSDEKYCLEGSPRGGVEEPDSSLESNLITEGPTNPIASAVLPSGAVPADHPPGYGVEMPQLGSTATGSLPAAPEVEKAAEFPRIRFESSPSAEIAVESVAPDGSDGFGSVTEFGVAPGAAPDVAEQSSVAPIPQSRYPEVPPQPNGPPEPIPTESAERLDAEERRKSAEAANRASELLRAEAAHREAQRTEAAHRAAEAAHREALRAEAAQRSAELRRSMEAAQRSAELLRAAEAAHRSAELQRAADAQRSAEAATAATETARTAELAPKSAEAPNRSAETPIPQKPVYLAAPTAPSPPRPLRPRRPTQPKPSERRPSAAKSRESTESHRIPKNHPNHNPTAESHHSHRSSHSREADSSLGDTSGPKSGLHLKSKSYRSADHPDPSFPYSTVAPLQPLPIGAAPLQNLPLIAVPMASAGFAGGGHVAGYAAAVHPLTFAHSAGLQPILFVPDCANYGPCPQQMRGNSAESRTDQRNSAGSAQFEAEEPARTQIPVAESPPATEATPAAITAQPEAPAQSRVQPNEAEAQPQRPPQPQTPNPQIPAAVAIPQVRQSAQPKTPKPKSPQPPKPKADSRIPTFVGQPGRRDFSLSAVPSQSPPPKPMESQLNPLAADFGSVHGPSGAAESAEQTNIAHDQPEAAAEEPAAEETAANEVYATEPNPEAASGPAEPNAEAAENPADFPQSYGQAEESNGLPEPQAESQQYPAADQQPDTAPDAQNQPYPTAEAENPPEEQNIAENQMETQNPAEFATEQPPGPIQRPTPPIPKPRPQPRIPAANPKPKQRPNPIPLASRPLGATPTPRRPAIGGAWATYAQHPVTRPPAAAATPQQTDEAAALAELTRQIGVNKGAAFSALLRRIEQILRSEGPASAEPPPNGRPSVPNGIAAEIAKPPLSKKTAELSKKIVAEPANIPIVDSQPMKAAPPPPNMGALVKAATTTSSPNADLEVLKRHRVTKMIRVTAHPHRWHPSLSTNSPSRPESATPASGESAAIAVVRRRHSPRPSQRSSASDRRS